MYASPSAYTKTTMQDLTAPDNGAAAPEPAKTRALNGAHGASKQETGQAAHERGSARRARAPVRPVITTDSCPPVSKLGRDRSRYTGCLKKAAKYQVCLIELRIKIQDREDELTAMLEEEELLLSKFSTHVQIICP